MTTAQQIKEILKTGTKTSETFNGITVVEIVARITISQALEFMTYLRGVATSKGRSTGNINGGTLTILSDWYEVGKVTISIDHITGKSLRSKTNYNTITWTKDMGQQQ